MTAAASIHDVAREPDRELGFYHEWLLRPFPVFVRPSAVDDVGVGYELEMSVDEPATET